MKVTKKQIEAGRKLAEKFGFKRIWINDKDEFFSDENNCSNSVGGKKELYAEVLLVESTEKTSGTNDLGKVEDVIQAIETAVEASVVEAILKAETEGKNREAILTAAEKKIQALTQKTTE